jgi:serine/threonine protein kinase
MSQQLPPEPARGGVVAKPGDRFGKYTIVSLYATGGMAEVYLAIDNLDRPIALKFPTMRTEWLKREAKISARFDHENVVGIYEFDRTESGAAYIAMPFLTGRTLEDALREGQSLSIKRRIDIILQVLNGLRYSHANDVIHRDIKPSNIFLLDDARVKIFDFGIARHSESTATWPAMIIGTPAYMSPEQAEAKRLDERSDLFSVGSVLYELLVGEVPFGTGREALVRIPTREPDFSRITERALIPVLRRALRKDLDERYQTAEEFASDLRRALESLTETTQPIAPAPITRFALRTWLWIVPLLLLVPLRHGMERPATETMATTATEPLEEPAPEPPKSPAIAPIHFSDPAPEATLDAGRGETIEMVLIKPKPFLRGQRRVYLSRPYYIGKYEVTEGQFDAVLRANPNHLHLNNFPGKRHPVDSVTFEEAEEFCRFLSARTKVCVRLPSEAEWESACRSRTTSSSTAWFASNSGAVTHPVGTRAPNELGLYDMQGNVSEWCADWFGDIDEARALDPRGPATGIYRVSRGGSINSDAETCRCDFRGRALPGRRHHVRGFRIVVSAADCN